MHFSLFEYNFVYLSLAYRTKRYLKYQDIHILLFHLRAIFSEPGSYVILFKKWKRNSISFTEYFQQRWETGLCIFRLTPDLSEEAADQADLPNRLRQNLDHLRTKLRALRVAQLAHRVIGTRLPDGVVRQHPNLPSARMTEWIRRTYPKKLNPYLIKVIACKCLMRASSVFFVTNFYFQFKYWKKILQKQIFFTFFKTLDEKESKKTKMLVNWQQYTEEVRV